MAVTAAPSPWRNRIVGSGEEAPDQLMANPLNWRIHPAAQRNALRGSLDTVGWVQQVLVNRTTGHVVDGHARVEEALSRGEPKVPVLYLDLTDEEEALVLTTLDPLAGMAIRDDAKLAALLAEVALDPETLEAMFGGMAGFHVDEAGIADLPTGDRNGFRQMAFIVSDEQAEIIEAALRLARDRGPFVDDNQNKNGNALARIAEAYRDDR